MEIINVSAKTGDGVEDAFKHIIELLIKKSMDKGDINNNNKINLAENNNKNFSNYQSEKNNNDTCC